MPPLPHSKPPGLPLMLRFVPFAPLPIKSRWNNASVGALITSSKSSVIDCNGFALASSVARYDALAELSACTNDWWNALAWVLSA